MLNTYSNVITRASSKGLVPYQIDGIPEGFSYKEADVTIGGKEHLGQYVAFLPLKEEQISSTNKEDLLDLYKGLCQKK